MSPEPCPVAHKSPNHPVIGSSGRVCVVVPRGLPSGKRRGGGERGQIREWSPGSRRRLLFGLGCIDFERERGKGGRWVSLTLTYGHDPGSDRFRRDRDAFLKWLRRRYPGCKYVWKVEFHQHWRGGVPHLHMMVLVPNGSEGRLRSLRRDGWDAWAKVAGSRYRFDARWAEARVMATYVAADYTMGGRKLIQQRVPDGWGLVGRWWAISGLRARWITRPITHRQFVVARALVRLHYAATTTRCGSSDGFGSAWVLSDSGESFVEAVTGFLDGSGTLTTGISS